MKIAKVLHHGQTRYRVNDPNGPEGKRQRKFFETREAADDYVKQRKDDTKAFGVHYATLPPAERAGIAYQLERLKQLGWTLPAAVDFVEKHGKAALAPSISLAKLAEDFMTAKEAAGLRDRYVKTLRASINRFLIGRRDKLVADVTPAEIQEYISSNGWAPATMRSYLVDVRTLFAFAVKRKYVGENPALAVDLPSDKEEVVNSTPDPTPTPNSPPVNPESDGAAGLQKPQRPPLPDIKKLFKEHRTFAGLIKAFLKPIHRAIPRLAQGPTPEADQARFERIFRPWPKWVFKLGAEVWHADFPTIERDVFFQSFRVFHVCFFRCPINPEDSGSHRKMSNAVDRVNVEVFPLVMASYFGHSLEHLEAARKRVEAKRAAGEISAAEFADQMKFLALDHMETMLGEMLSGRSFGKEVKTSDLTRAVENARRKTFDEYGFPKESPLIPIYRVMLSNWIAVENMSGPKELANFLTPHLKGNSKSPTGEIARIATMCSRLGVKFRGKSRTLELQRRQRSL